MDKTLKLEIYHSTWAMERRHPTLPELTLSEQCDQVAEAGFSGLNIDLGTSFIPSLNELSIVLKNSGLACAICAFPETLDDVSQSLEESSHLGATALVLNARIFPLHAEGAVDFVQRSIDLGKQADIPVQFETHRFTLTNDLLFTCHLLELCPELKLVADLSHYVVGREMPMPVDEFHQKLITKILNRAVSIQGRVANREQIQIPIHFKQHQQWVSQFYVWWEQGMQQFIESTSSGDVFNFTCELGPPDYAITDEQGYELSDRWSESLLFKQQIESIWEKLTTTTS
jgi:hypothetical protein